MIRGDLVKVDSQSDTDLKFLRVMCDHMRSHHKARKVSMLSTLSGLLLPFITKVIMGPAKRRTMIGALGGSRCANSANPAVGGAE